MVLLGHLGGMEEEHVCREALGILVDCVQLCKIVRGEAESCTFNSVCSDTFTSVVMQHLCSATPSDSLPCRFLLPVIESELSPSSHQNGTRSTRTSTDSNPDLHMHMRHLEEVLFSPFLSETKDFLITSGCPGGQSLSLCDRSW